MRLHSYQKEAVEFIKDHKKCALLMEMGLGKTISTLTAIHDLIYQEFAVAKVLVIAPLKVAESTWPDEIAKWPHLSPMTYQKVLGPKKARVEALEATADVYVINRENVVWLVDHLGKAWDFDMIVIDELSSFKSPKAKRFKKLKKKIPTRMVGLTGTPAPNGLEDLWAPFYLLDGGQRLERNLTAFRAKYFDPASYIYQGGVKIVTKYKPKKGAKEAIYGAIDDIAMSMKSKDYLELPDRVNRTVSISVPMKNYHELEKEMIAEIEGETIVAGSAAVVTGKLHQYAQGAVYTEDGTWQEVHKEKLKAADEIIESMGGNPLLVFYWFKHDLERLMAKYPDARTLDGPEDVEAWNKGDVPLLLAHPASAGHGLNLQAGGHHILWFSLTWSLELYQQANARLDRQGQDKPVIVHHLVAKDTVDETIMKVLEGKKNTQDALMEALKSLKEQITSKSQAKV